MPTYHARLAPHPALDAMGELFGRVQRKLHAAFRAGREWRGDLQTSFYRPFGITSVHLDHVRRDLEAKLKSVTEVSKVQAQDLRDKAAAKGRQVRDKTKRLAKLGKAADRHARDPLAAHVVAWRTHARKRLASDLHRHKRRAATLLARAGQLDERAENPSLAFGTRKLFAEQNELKANGHADHAAWCRAWRDARSGHFLCEGASDRSRGNSFVKMHVREDGSVSVELRLPEALKHLADRTCSIKGHDVYSVDLGPVTFPHGGAAVASWLAAHDSGRGGPVTVRFVRDDTSWRIMVTAAVEHDLEVVGYERGALGIDLNVDHVAVARVTADGNFVRAWRFPLVTYGLRAAARDDLIRKVAAQVAALAKALKLPLVHEKLDFRAKRNELGVGEGPRRARMLSSFACSAFADALAGAAARSGLHLAAVNPAYTSLIGRVKFARRYGLSVHASAALSVARRAMGHSERVPTRPDLRFGDGDRVALDLPAPKGRRRGRRHVWSTWAALAGRVKAVGAARAEARRQTRRGGARTGAPAPAPGAAREGGFPPPRATEGSRPSRKPVPRLGPATGHVPRADVQGFATPDAG